MKAFGMRSNQDFAEFKEMRLVVCIGLRFFGL